MNENLGRYEKICRQLRAEILELNDKIATQEWKLRQLRQEVAQRDKIIRERVEDETRYLNERIELILEANRQQAERIKQLEREKTLPPPSIEPRPSRNNMIAMCQERDWWLGDDVLMDEDETLRYPWIDMRDQFRYIALDEFFEWIHQSHLEREREKHRNRYDNDPAYRERINEDQRRRRANQKQKKDA